MSGVGPSGVGSGGVGPGGAVPGGAQAHPYAAQTPAPRRSPRAIAPGLLVGAAVIAAFIAAIGALAASPIYETGRLWIVGFAGAALAFGVVWIGTRLRWGAMTLAALAAAFTLVVLPLGVPDALGNGPSGLLRGLADGLAAVALGWKQLLTLSLPVGTYQTVLVPFLTVVFVSVAVATALALRGGRRAAFAALSLVAPVLFGTLFGSSAVSDPLRLLGVSITAPRELVLWLLAFGAAVAWVAWASGRDRRAALKRGRLADAELMGQGEAADRGALRRNGLVRGSIAIVTVAAALIGALALAPVVTPDARAVPRDAIDPELVIRSKVSPLSAYRAWKRDDALRAPIFSVAGSDGALPDRLSLAVLSGYDGVDFSVGDPGVIGRFTRFPSGGGVVDPVRVTVQIQTGYSDIWVPLSAPLASPPSFSGPRAGELADSFYLNRETGSAVSIPTGDGLRDGDGFTATMSGSGDARLGSAPVTERPLIDLEKMPELETWLELQGLPSNATGFSEALERLRARGYLSHSLTDAGGEGAWARALAETHPIRFVSSPGGHSAARIEQLFAQLTEQQLAAGPDAPPQMLVAGIGDDEQFAAAAALIARAMGFDSRVVVGVRLGVENGVPGVPACVNVCTGENIAAWVEVRGRDGVWASFDASPQIDITPTMLQKGEQLPEFPTQPEERDASESEPPVGMSDQQSGGGGNAGLSGLAALWPFIRVGLLSLSAFALVMLVVLFLPFVKRLRERKRRQAATPEVQALGAWDELIDAYSDTGMRAPDGLGREAVMEELGVEGGDWIAWTVDQAVYSREGIGAETAAMLWQVVDARVAERRTAMSRWRRLRARYSLASFGGLVSQRIGSALRGRGRKGALR